MKKNNSLEVNFSQALLISFDVFDTLLGRTVSVPSDVFHLMQEDFSKMVGIPIYDFCDLRKKAEKKAKQDCLSRLGLEDVNLFDIYKMLFSMIGIDDDEMQLNACDIEMKWEKRCLITKKSGKEIYQKALSTGKDIVIVSDMYLPKAFIESVLIEHGFNHWKKLYVSSETGKTKTSGNAFQLLKDDFKVDYESIVHIGDNGLGDHEVPTSLGVSTVHIPRSVEVLENNYKFGNEIYKNFISQNRTISSSVVGQLIADKLFDNLAASRKGVLNSDPFLFGYNFLGPLMIGFASWLNCEARRLGIDQLLFLSRDGEIMHKVFDAMNFGSGIKLDYCFASRRIARVCSIYTMVDIERVLDESIHDTDLASYLDYRFCLDKKDIDLGVLREYGFSGFEHRVKYHSDKEQIRRLLYRYKSQIIRNCERQRNFYKSYLNEFFDANVKKAAIVDIGYSGKIQRVMSDLIGIELQGFYLSTSDSIIANGVHPNDSHAYIDNLVSEDTVRSSDLGIHKYRFIYETLICNADDSFEGFVIEGDNVELKFWSDSNANIRKNFVLKAHQGALEFAHHFTSQWPVEQSDFFIEGRLACKPIDAYLKYPVPEDLNLFYDIEFEDRFGPGATRILLSSKDVKMQDGIVELWNEGVYSKRQFESGNQLTNRVISRVIEKFKTLFFLRCEQYVFRMLLPENKMHKYLKNRNRFFSESPSKFIRWYGRVTY